MGEQAIVIFGRVTRGDGSALPGAAVTLCDLAGDQLDRATTDGGGHYQVVPPSGGTYLLICSSAQRRPRASLVAVSDTAQRHDVGLEGGGATLAGTVGTGTEGTGTGGTGTGGLTETVLTLTDVSGVVVAVTRSDAAGTYLFADLPEGVYTLTAAGSGIPPVAETVQVPAEGRVTHDLTLRLGAVLSGTVRSATGSRPVAEALATLVSADGSVVGSAVTGENGTFRFDDVGDGVYTITASGYAPVASEIEIGRGTTTEVELVLIPPSAGPEPETDPVPAPATSWGASAAPSAPSHSGNGHVPAHAAADGTPDGSDHR